MPAPVSLIELEGKWVRLYLQRIGYSGSLQPDLAVLAALQQVHMERVPFENLDVHWGREITLDLDPLFRKIVFSGRGGFCYELNSLFGHLLRALGYSVTWLSARDAYEGGYGPEFDHLTLLVRPPMGEPEDDRLVDVGWGDSFRTPLRLEPGLEQEQGALVYRLDALEDGDLLLRQRSADRIWDDHYRFSLTPRRVSDFAGMCHYHQTSPDSHFTQKRIITRATPEGRVSLSENCLVRTVEGVRTERQLDDKEYETALWEYFGVKRD